MVRVCFVLFFFSSLLPRSMLTLCIVLYTSGTDSLLKSASAHTGQVTSKILLPASRGGTLDPPTLLHALSPQTLLVATDSSALYLYDLRLPSSLSSHVTTKPSQEHHPHDDYISSLTPLPPSTESTSGESKQWVTTGGTTLAVTDLRRGVLVKSEDQEEELLSSVWVDGLRRSKGKAIVGNGNGVLTLWEKGVWDDQEERILVDREGQESLDCIVLRKDGGVGKELAVGVGDGTVRLVRLGVNRVVETLRHDDVEGVLGVGFDVHGRLISGGGSIVKVWSEAPGSGAHEDDDDSDANDSEDKGEKRLAGSDASEEESDSEEEKQKRKKKKKRAKKGKDIGNGILKFRGLE